MAADDQKVKRQDAAVASSSLLRTSSARMYGKNSLKVFWAIGLFFLLSFMERTTPTEAVVYPEEMKKAMEEREKADFRELPTVNVYGSLGNLSIPALPYLDDLEAVVKDLLAAQEPRPSIGFYHPFHSFEYWLKGIKGELCSRSTTADGPALTSDNIKSISFQANDSGEHLWSPSVLFDVHITDYNERTHIVRGTSLKARGLQIDGGYVVSFTWNIGKYITLFEMHPGTYACLKRFMTFAFHPHNWTEMNFVPFTNAGTLAYGVHIEQGKKKVSGVFLYLGWNADVKAAVYGCHHIDGELEVNQRAIEKMWNILWEMCGPTLHYNAKQTDVHMNSLHNVLSAGPILVLLPP
eukprot:GHVS01073015.1.p1 GENE.GHVS01073015.1~~GHVS01073015.1.p1  ORF type:complete len:372 (+),score=28.97 GHVS01073015.1:65-1117(+)